MFVDDAYLRGEFVVVYVLGEVSSGVAWNASLVQLAYTLSTGEYPTQTSYYQHRRLVDRLFGGHFWSRVRLICLPFWCRKQSLGEFGRRSGRMVSPNLNLGVEIERCGLRSMLSAQTLVAGVHGRRTISPLLYVKLSLQCICLSDV
jgi:hypothetical protein